MLKWENYDVSENSWEPEEFLNGCENLVQEFTDRQAHTILAGRKTENHRVEYMIKYKGDFPDRVVSSVEALEKWPLLVLEFLERHARLGKKRPAEPSTSQRRVSFSSIVETQAVGNPIQVTCKYFTYFFTLFFVNDSNFRI